MGRNVRAFPTTEFFCVHFCEFQQGWEKMCEGTEIFKQNLLVSASSSSSGVWMKLLFAGAEPSPQQLAALLWGAIGKGQLVLSLRPKQKNKNKNTYVAVAPGCSFLQHKVM